ncbi:MAG: LytTR family DNA-binding domain-containing protein [Lachnospiraceae bacterium]|nr:LytTR family DNA-binding domain-containing protein [Lachnospiraceae bacterium]
MDIFVCDDEKTTCAELENIILAYTKEKNVQMEVSVFYSGDKLADYLKKGNNNPTILFLDIELPGMNGLGVGSFIRGDLEDEQMFIVYISSKEQYALQLFENRPFNFLIKPLSKDGIFKVLNDILKIVDKENYYFEFQNKKVHYQIPYKDILYFQSDGKKINVVGLKDTISFYGKLSEVEVKLQKHFFLNIHKSYLVNYNYVKEYTYDWIKMINGDILNISKANRVAVRKRILEREKNGVRNR